MVNGKKLTEKLSALAKRVSSALNDTQLESNKGHFIVYTSDAKRFMIPLSYLESSIFVELFKMSEDEFGLPSDGPITLPCDAVFMEFALSLLRRRGSKAMDRVLLDSVFKHCQSPCSSSTVGFSQQIVGSWFEKFRLQRSKKVQESYV
ncbi:auxin-responsive protein SAUR68-like [Asparagus officinalis]|uniref:auxin-responsive protein SAUR68-like n=1 Tax=Asparagus officinalis TaxID=4686 RepID=UPI00098E0445|nr:auxin-responsive protein SAUR68-like [Asparagus officinalis]